MSITIHSNGSKWLGEEPDTIKQLIDVLSDEASTLDPTFEDYGDFVYEEAGTLWVSGNFYNLSHVFNVSVPIEERELLDDLVAAVESHKQSDRYQQVLEAKIVDAGGNEFARVTAQSEVTQFLQSHRGGPYHLRAVKVGEKIDPYPGDCDREGDQLMGDIGCGQA